MPKAHTSELRIIFMGTPDFAVPSLDLLLRHGYNVVAVITAADKYGGRGKKRVIQSAVKRYAQERQLAILQPTNLKSPAFQERLRALNADLQIVVAFRMLPEAVWNMPPFGTYNLHGSLLPAYRGAAPINWAIINGESETGVTAFKLKHAIDTGDMLFQYKLPIYSDDTAGDVHDRMMHLGAFVVLQTVQAVAAGNVDLYPQDDRKVSKAPKIFHETCAINLTQPVRRVYNFIRGLSPYPTAWIQYRDKKIKVFRAQLHETGKTISSAFSSDGKTYVHLHAQGGYIALQEIQLEGKRRMSVRDFLNGSSLFTDYS